VLVSGDGIVAEDGETIGRATNNQAEYEALLAGLQAADQFGFDEVEVRGDSQLIVKQVKGAWDTNDPISGRNASRSGSYSSASTTGR